jgi:predicted small secreted protein
MSKIYLTILLLAALIIVTGCKTHSGSREYIPGQGWVPND